MAVVAIIKRGENNVPALVERINKGEEFCFVVNQKVLPWHIAPATGRENLKYFEPEIRAAGGDPNAAPLRKKHKKKVVMEVFE
ncbi:hypothetical protein [Marinagarivorans cellulosilyticus]|uniref:hypothetical protein n=1 Tax=Marinagarivorans cellulosilyticus TaxID=2721545 RepID=UPI001F191A0E|nr:hypothetical protein [Marinagarivorans cellulosilyticus]